ncbi:MAG: MarR family transcriptional regulator [Pseudomonadota bacterium]
MMLDDTANLLGVIGLSIADRIHTTAMEVMNRAGETPAALVIIGYGFGPSNDKLKRVLGLSHPGTVRLVDRLVSDGLVERRKGRDKREIALYLTDAGRDSREDLLAGRLASIRSLLTPLDTKEQESLDAILRKLLVAMHPNDMERRRLCRLCDDRVCKNCPIPADFRSSEPECE